MGVRGLLGVVTSAPSAFGDKKQLSPGDHLVVDAIGFACTWQSGVAVGHTHNTHTPHAPSTQTTFTTTSIAWTGLLVASTLSLQLLCALGCTVHNRHNCR